MLQTRQKFAGILGVWQEFLTQYAAKFAEKTQADAYAHKLLYFTYFAGMIIPFSIFQRCHAELLSEALDKVALGRKAVVLRNFRE